jgi:hypothetical protein
MSTFALGLATAVAPGVAEGIFQDGFEECGAGRWSSGNPSPQPEQITGLLPLVLAEALGACAPSLISAEFRLADGSLPGAPTLTQIGNQQSAILGSFGTGGMLPTAGGAMIALSSGTARDAAHAGYISPQTGADFGRSSAGPAVFMSAHGNSFPAGGSCPNGPNSAHDSVVLRLTLEVPAGADRLAFDWRMIDSNYPEWVCGAFIDYFLGIVVAGTHPSLPVDRNVVLDGIGRPVSVDSPDMVICTGCPAGDGPLAGTGYAQNDSAATLWRTAFVPVIGGETIVLDLAAFDVGDGLFDNLVLLDGLRWIWD